jgi:hypothetical protein
MASDLSDEFAGAGPEAPDIVNPNVAPEDRPDFPAVWKPGRTLHRKRFALVYGLLALALGAAIAGIVIYAGRSINPAPAWSSWKPSGGGLGAAKQIASHVGGTYRLGSGTQLVDVIAKAPSVSPASQQIPIHYIAVRGSKGSGDAIFPVDSGNSVMFSLCGLGQSCSIATGTPSVARGTLVRREILELALYTFKYVGGVDHVIAFMPPTPGAQPTLAVYLQKSELKGQLKEPLADTLATKVPAAAKISPSEQQTIDETTGTHVYKFSLSQAQQGDAILVLAPLA